MAERAANKPLEAPKDAEHRHTKELLDEMPKYRIKLYQEKLPKPQLPERPVGINGYFYNVKRGYFVEVPEEVYLILVRAGEVDPQKPEHEHEVPVISVQPLAD